MNFKITFTNSLGDPQDTRRCKRSQLGETIQRMVEDNIFGLVASDKITVEVER